MISYREIHDPAELKEIVTLQTLVWGMSPAEAVPDNMMMAVIHSGGLVTGAELDGELVGFGLMLPTRRGDTWALWSHMAGVIPRYQGQGIGFGIKQAQRRWALDHDYSVIRWTFDPLQRGNAHFNLHRLQADSQTYHTNFYGAMADGINAGMQSDRLEVEWRLTDRQVSAAARGEPPVGHRMGYPADDFLLYTDPDGAPHMREPLALTSEFHFVEIPRDLAALKRRSIAEAQRWQLKLRIVMQMAFANGYRAIDVADSESRCWYILARPNHG
jgi:predicted GNAT superfamily acetyltransferase